MSFSYRYLYQPYTFGILAIQGPEYRQVPTLLQLDIVKDISGTLL